MAVNEISGFLKYKDENGDVNLLYPITTKDNVDGMDDVDAHLVDTENPHGVTKTQVGLGNVENKSSEDIRAELTKKDVTDALGYTPPTTDTVYTHPGYTAKSNGLYKVTVDDTGHVLAATAVTKDDITALGIPAQDTNTTYSAATTSTDGLMSASDKSKLNGLTTENWTFTLEDGSTVTKAVYVG